VPFLNATDNVATVLQLAGFEPADARQRAIELLDNLESGTAKAVLPSCGCPRILKRERAPAMELGRARQSSRA
jgi:hypothetical protein